MKTFLSDNKLGFLCTLMLSAVFAASAVIGTILL